MGRLDGKIVIVTGASDEGRISIGAVYARALAAEGARVAVADILDCASVAADIDSAGGEALSLALDVRDEDSVNAMVADTVARFGGLDILINNAAIGSNTPPVPVTEMSVAAWDDLFASNVRGPFLCSRAAIPEMRRRGYGKIVNVGSAMMFSGSPERLHYVTAKGAIYAMTRSLANELGKDGIRVNTIAYGLITSDFVAERLETDTEWRSAIFGARAIPEHVRAEDCVGTLIYLAAPDSDAMTGQCLVVDGGDVMM